jgi:hypothetical protein
MDMPRGINTQDAYHKAIFKLQNKFQPRDLSCRLDSYPYLSSDTYYFLCDLHITSETSLRNYLKNPDAKFKKMYILGSLVNELIKNLDLIKDINLESIVIMESDNLQKASVLEKLLLVSKKVFSNNLHGSSKFISPIPLGLERQAYRSAGNLKNFKRKTVIDPKLRTINFLIAWNDDTNSNRKQVRDVFKNVSRTLNVEKRLSAKSVHKLMRKTLFVPSPAGNGLDCHRTWEALYLGCVPVVLAKEFCGDDSWPVLVVQNWQDLAEMKQEELIKSYVAFKKLHTEPLAFTKSILDRI